MQWFDQWFAKKKYCPRLHNIMVLLSVPLLSPLGRIEGEGLAFLLCVELNDPNAKNVSRKRND